MSRAGKIARRSFLIGSAAIAGGVAFGIWRYRDTGPNPLLAELPEGGAALTPYVMIDGEGVTVIAPRAEMGQGVQSALAMLVAEELDLPWDQVKIDHGPPAVVYYNGAVVAEGLPFASTDQGILARNARAFGDVVSKFMSLQLTGGSSSMVDGFDKMRKAGAAARAVLIEAAAKQAGVPAKGLKTEGGAVVLPDGTRKPYTALAAACAGIAPPADPPLKPRQDWTLIGKPVQRRDMVAKCTGTARYGIDMALPGMVYATVRTSPRFGAGIKRLDTKKAEAARGVKMVVPVEDGFGVIADNTWRAFQAADLVEVEWEPAPYAADSAALFKQVAASFTEARRDSRFKDAGDVDTALAGADVVEAEYRIPFLAHAPLEPMNATVKLGKDRLDIWVGTQIPLQVVASAAALSGLSGDNIHVHVLPIGGSFGRRLEDDYIRQAVEVAQSVPGVPVKMTWQREEDMTHDFCRPLAMARGRGAVAGGKVTALDLGIAAPSVTASQMGRLGIPAAGPDTAIVAGAWDQPFAIPAYRVSGYRVPDMPPVSSWRSVGASGNGFFHESFLDELIHAAGADPLAERLRLVTDPASRAVLEAVGKMSGWGATLPKGKGRGLAFTLSFGVPAAEVVEVTDTPDGIRIDKVWVAAEVGAVIDPVNIEAQMTGGVVWGLGHAMGAEITFAGGEIEQTNFDSYPAMRLRQCPVIEAKALQTSDKLRGIGEPAVPPAAPALANAIFAATGKRIRQLPLNREVTFL
ncbi:xanthine dehydrogenase family protein molybdopterin-binding subunit [Acidimangrovimonas pyrenivorans]|uniref:Molybdopterin cofactor-binding domain-containing protein n=1 Tax=Acidimangrovimonas pyrenivorans TaxID=2030798 RepID=A0ABV7AFP3_9RHOB